MNPRASTLALMVLLLSGCGTVSVSDHYAKAADLRARTPYTTKIGLSRSMETILPSGSMQTVRAKPYDQLQAGDMAVFWPMGSQYPVCHFVHGRLGTDSWRTIAMAAWRDDTYRWILTRENYIGVIY